MDNQAKRAIVKMSVVWMLAIATHAEAQRVSSTVAGEVESSLPTEAVSFSGALVGTAGDNQPVQGALASLPEVIIGMPNRSVGIEGGISLFSVDRMTFREISWVATLLPGAPWAQIFTGASGTLPAYGHHVGLIGVAYEANPIGGKERTATIVVIVSGASGGPFTLTLTQAANPVLDLPPPVWLAPAPIGAGQFTLNWEAPEAGDGYRLEVASTADFSDLKVGANVEGLAVRSFAVNQIGAGSTNYCRIRTLQGGLGGAFSDVLKVVAAANAPYPVNRIPLRQTVTVGGSNTWRLSTLFAGSGLTFAVTSAAPDVISASLQASTATFSYLTAGTAPVTVYARNVTGLSSFVTVMFDVTPRADVGLAAGAPRFVPALNVYAQTVWVTNNTGHTVNAIKLSVRGILPAKTTLREAASQTGSDAVLIWNGIVTAGEAVPLNLSYFNPALTQVTVASIAADFSLVDLVPAVTFDPAPVKIANLGLARDLSGIGVAGFLLEFPTQKGSVYHIFYRDSLTESEWRRVQKPVTALGSWQMWYDTGAPATAPPSPGRFYKVQKQQ